jgi:soluble lytic murein transglycosylase-like protein
MAKTVVVLVLTLVPAAHAARSVDEGQWSVQCAAVYASAYGVPVELVDAVIQVESGWNRYAVSNKGAAGLMQLMPATALRFGVRDRFDVEDNIRGGVAYLAWLIRLFQGDLRLALAAYNAGESLVLLQGLDLSSPEIVGYVDHVTQVYRALRTRTSRKRELVNSMSRTRGG